MDHILDSDIHIISEITKNISILDKLIKSETFEIEEKYKGHEKRINYFFSSLLKGEITNEYIKILTNSFLENNNQFYWKYYLKQSENLNKDLLINIFKYCYSHICSLKQDLNTKIILYGEHLLTMENLWNFILLLAI